MQKSGSSRLWQRLSQLIALWTLGIALVGAAFWIGGRASAQGSVIQIEPEPAPEQSAAVGTTQFLPYIPYRFPPVPFTPTLLRIEGSYDGQYTVDWTSDDPIVSYYVLEQYFNETFQSPNIVYQGPDSQVSLARPVLAYYYYRVKAVTEYNGVAYSSGYSNIRVASAIGIGVDRNLISLSETDPCTTLRWKYTGVREVFIRTAKGVDFTGVVGDGSTRVCPSYSTTYTARVVLTNGATQTWQVPLTVTGTGCNRDPYVNYFNSTRNPVARNEPFTLSWNVQCAREVFFVRGTTETPTVGVGQMQNLTITSDTTFQLKIRKADGTFVYASILVRVR